MSLTMAYLMYIPKQLILKSTYVISTVIEIMQDKDIFLNVVDETVIRGQSKRKSVYGIAHDNVNN